MNFAGTSDYIFRGISQSDEDPEFSAGLDVSYGILYAGIWGSGVDPDFVVSSTEIDFYAGIKPIWGPVTFDFGVIYYWYPDSDSSPVDIDYVELKAGYSMASPWIKNLTTGTTLYWTSDNSGETGEVFTVESAASYALPQIGIFSPTISGVYGTAYAEDRIYATLGAPEDEYSYWSVGLTLGVEKLSFDFRYWDTDIDIPDAHNHIISDERFVFTAKVTLP